MMGTWAECGGDDVELDQDCLLSGKLGGLGAG